MNEKNTKEYWYFGDPIIKNYNLLFNYSKSGKETITIVQSDKYESKTIILFFCISSFVTLLFYIILIIIRVRKINQDAIDFQDKSQQKEKIKIQRMMKNQSGFGSPKKISSVKICQKMIFSQKKKNKKKI